ncbi:membrane dipeptidase [Paraburkholderia caballeronis]|uniref:membrane dipeptidase n=1 Tax=Paraburkholderia caballeronis TaxID=416943 RepID=UPI0010662251|nr:membrane dipeptidase [Paraburkholderia caballeronis]
MQGPTLEAIRLSKQPVAITHANAGSRFSRRRNRTDDVLRALADNGGMGVETLHTRPVTSGVNQATGHRDWPSDAVPLAPWRALADDPTAAASHRTTNGFAIFTRDPHRPFATQTNSPPPRARRGRTHPPIPL